MIPRGSQGLPQNIVACSTTPSADVCAFSFGIEHWQWKHWPLFPTTRDDSASNWRDCNFHFNEEELWSLELFLFSHLWNLNHPSRHFKHFIKRGYNSDYNQGDTWYSLRLKSYLAKGFCIFIGKGSVEGEGIARVSNLSEDPKTFRNLENHLPGRIPYHHSWDAGRLQ